MASDEGRRLCGPATDARGRAVPKQFWALPGEGTLLDAALGRARVIADPECILVVVAAEHEEHWRPLLAELPAENVLIEPRDRGTAAGFLLALLTALERDPAGRIAMLPSDHHVQYEPILAFALLIALRDSFRDPTRVTLLGITPDSTETECGWIVPAPGTGEMRAVLDLVEKPDAARAAALTSRGAVWNSSLLVATAQAWRTLLAGRRPVLVSRFAAAFAGEGSRSAALEHLYAGLDACDLSRDVLQGLPPELRVLIVAPCGWTDLGMPSRAAAPPREHNARVVTDRGVRWPAEAPLRLDLALAQIERGVWPPMAPRSPRDT